MKTENREQAFIRYLLPLLENNKGLAAALRRADNPNTEYQSWDCLAGFGIALDKSYELTAFATVGALFARGKYPADGHISLGRALSLAYTEAGDPGKDNAQAKVKLRRLLACDSQKELCRVLRPLVALIQSKTTAPLEYSRLLREVLYFDSEQSREKIRARWAQDFYTSTEAAS